MLTKEKAFALAEKFHKAKLIDDKSLTQLLIAIHYYYYDVTLKELEKIYKVSESCVRKSIHGRLVYSMLGEEFYNKLQEKSVYKKRIAYKKRKNNSINFISEDEVTMDELKEINNIKREDATIKTKKELKMMRTALMFLKEDYSYSEMSSKIGYSKTSISNYLTDDELQYLLQDEYYLEIKNKLAESKPAPLLSIIRKKEKMHSLIESMYEDGEKSLSDICEELLITDSVLSLYLSDPYFKELVCKKVKRK